MKISFRWPFQLFCVLLVIGNPAWPAPAAKKPRSKKPAAKTTQRKVAKPKAAKPRAAESASARPANAVADVPVADPRLRAHINAVTRNDSQSKETVLIAENKTAKLPIIIAADASQETEALAKEVASTLEQISGAKFEIQKGGSGAGLYIGTLAEFPTPSATEGLKIFNTYDGREAFAIRVEDGRIKIIGATPRGVPFGVTRFLENLGCRWFFQSPVWNVVPGTEKLSYNRNQTDRPELLSRHFGYPRGDHFEKGDPDAGAALYTWWRHNYTGESLQTQVAHSATDIRIRFKDEFEKHPEYTALVNGRRTPGVHGQLCLSNPEVQKLAAQYAVEYFDKHPDADMVSMGPDDGGGWCQCDVCKAMFPNPGDGAFNLVNVAAKAVEKAHPGKLVSIYAYNWHCDPPPFQMEPNVYIELTTAMLLNTKYSLGELLELWPKKAHYVSIYDYWAVYDWTRDRLPAGRTSDSSYIAEKLPEYINSGIFGLTAESGTSWGGQGLGYYLASRVLWNSKTDINALREDFFQKAFGPAAQEMKTYYTRVDKASGPLAGPTFYRLAIDDLYRAEKAAQGDEAVLARIEQLKEYHAFLFLDNRVNAGVYNMKTPTPEVNPQRKQFVYDLIKWNYRIRNTYMTFWDFFADQSSRRFADEFEAPEWNFSRMRYLGKADEIPYRDDPTAPTREETDKVLQQAKAYYGEPVSMEATRWATDTDFVAPHWPAPAPQTPQQFLLQGPPDMVIEGKAGTPMKFTLSQGDIYTEKGDGTYTVRDRDGVLIATGRTKNRATATYEVNVPRDGFYFLHVDDNESGWSFAPTPGERSAFVLDRSKSGAIHCRRGTFWFYVPKGTKEIRMYAIRVGYPITLYTPAGKTAGNIPGRREGTMDVDSSGRVSVIPVPEGMDGKLWAGENMYGGAYYFLNIPNLLLTTPDGPIIPRELAEADGLDY